MPRRLFRAVWPLTLLLLVFALRTVGCKGRAAEKDSKLHFIRQPTSKWTIPPPLPSPTNPPGVTVIPNPDT